MKRLSFLGALLTIVIHCAPAFADGPNNFTAITPYAINTPRYSGQRAVDGMGRGWIVADTPIPINQAAGAVEATVAPMITILPTALPTAYSTPQFAAVAAGLKTLWIDNSTNQDVWCSNSTASEFLIHSNSTFWTNFGDRGLKMSAGVGCIHPGNTPASGVVSIGGEN